MLAPTGPDAVAALLATVVQRAVAAMGACDATLVLPEDPAWRDLAPGIGPADGYLSVTRAGRLCRLPQRPDGSTVHVLTVGEPVYVTDVRSPSRFGPFPAGAHSGTVSLAEVPLRAGGQVMGALAVGFDRPREWPEEDREALDLLAAHAAAALDRARLLAAAHRRAHQGEQLAATLARVGAAPDLPSALEALVRGVVSLLGGDHAVAQVYGPHPGKCSLTLHADGQSTVRRGGHDADDAALLPGTFGATLQAGGPAILVEDFWALDPQTYPWYQRMKRRGLRASVNVPIDAGGRRIGSLHVNHHQPCFFGPADLAMAETLAAQAGAAIERAQLCEAVQRRLAVERTVAGISARFVGPCDFDQAVSASLAEIGQLSAASRAYLFLFRDGGAVIDNTHEWCAEGVSAEIEHLQNLPAATFPWWTAKLRAGEVIQIADVSRLPREAAAEREILQGQGIKAVLVLPVYAGDELAGFLGFDDVVRTGTWPEEDLTLLRVVAEVIGSARQRQRAEVQIRAHTARLQTLAEAAQAFAETSLDYHAALDTVVRRTAEVLGDSCIIRLLSEDGQWLRAVAMHHLDPEALTTMREVMGAAAHRADEGLNGRVLQTGQPLRISVTHPEELRAWFKPEYHAYLDSVGIHSYLVVPLRARGRVIGTLRVSRDRPGHPYTAEDEAFLQNLADRAALAVENARLYEEAESAVRARDEFLSVAAHELRTPMTSLRVYTQFLLRQFEQATGPEPTKLRRALETIDQQSDKLARLVAQLLDITRLEAGRLTLAQEVTDLAALIEAVATTAETVTGQPILVRTPGAVQGLVDPLRLEQVLINLLDNAIKHGRGEGPIEVALGQPSPEVVQIAVRDHGPGIPPEHRARVFERFYQAEARRGTGGLGLGLYVSRQIVELHGGRIDLETPPDGGTRFVLTLPAGPDAGAAPVTEEGAA